MVIGCPVTYGDFSADARWVLCWGLVCGVRRSWIERKAPVENNDFYIQNTRGWISGLNLLSDEGLYWGCKKRKTSFCDVFDSSSSSDDELGNRRTMPYRLAPVELPGGALSVSEINRDLSTKREWQALFGVLFYHQCPLSYQRVAKLQLGI